MSEKIVHQLRLKCIYYSFFFNKGLVMLRFEDQFSILEFEFDCAHTASV